MRFFVAALMVLTVVPAFAQTTTTNETRGHAIYDRNENATKAGDIGIGAMIGDPMTVTGKYWLDESNALDAGVAFANSNTGIVADYLHHFRGAFANRGDFMTNISPYLGAGLAVSFDQAGNESMLGGDRLTDDQLGLGVRIPLGLEWLPRTVPAGVFAELTPGLGIGNQDTFAFLQVGAGARFYF